MSAVLDIPVAHNDVRLLASRDYADNAAGPSYIDFFDNARAAIGDPPGVSPVVRVILKKPCGVLTAHQLVLAQADATGDVIARNSEASGVQWGRWYRSDGLVVADGLATDSAGDGFFKIAGSVGTLMYAGGRAVLGTVSII